MCFVCDLLRVAVWLVCVAARVCVRIELRMCLCVAFVVCCVMLHGLRVPVVWFVRVGVCVCC